MCLAHIIDNDDAQPPPKDAIINDKCIDMSFMFHVWLTKVRSRTPRRAPASLDKSDTFLFSVSLTTHQTVGR